MQISLEAVWSANALSAADLLRLADSLAAARRQGSPADCVAAAGV